MGRDISISGQLVYHWPPFDSCFHTIDDFASISGLPLSPIPSIVIVAGVVVCYFINKGICRVINGGTSIMKSQIKLPEPYRFRQERWFYHNGISVGHRWLQSNLDRLAVTFRRNVTGVHNPTKGIVFDVIECLMERDFGFSTRAVRKGYQEIKKALLKSTVTKVVFMLHSQGGIEGGLILDWLLADVSRHALQKLEIYTFGNAANHFNNPIDIKNKELAGWLKNGQFDEAGDRVLRHIEHYANREDFVAKFGVLHYAGSHDQAGNRFAGRLSRRDGGGHLLDQHYLGSMFPLKKPYGPVDGNSSFMNTRVKVKTDVVEQREGVQSFNDEETLPPSTNGVEVVNVSNKSDKTTVTAPSNGFDIGDVSLKAATISVRNSDKRHVSELSRLWKYRDGHSPKDE